MPNHPETQVRQLLRKHFKSGRKVFLWMRTANPLLGQLSPNQMIKLGRAEKLLTFVKGRLEEGEDV